MGIALAVPCRIHDTGGGLREHRPRATVVVQGNELELGIGDLDPVSLALPQDPNLNRQRDRGLADGDRIGVAADCVADPDRLQNVMLDTATVTTVPLAIFVAVISAAASITDMIQPPKMLPIGLVCDGIASMGCIQQRCENIL